MSDNKTTSSGIGFTSLLLIAFIVLKLCSVITWSWFWVLSPFWIPCAIVLLLLGAIGVIKFSEARKRKKVLKNHSEAIGGLMNSIDEAKKSTGKWQQRLDEMQAVQRKADAARNQKELDEIVRRNNP